MLFDMYVKMTYNESMRRSVLVQHEAHERFGARLTRSEKALLERAAAIEGRTLTDFVLSNARKAAEATVRNHDILLLSARAGEAFARELARPARAVKALQEAARRNPGAMKI